MTLFEKEVLASILWQLRGYSKGYITERVTTRILRATLRRIKPKLIGISLSAISASKTDIDHAVPLKIIVDMLIKQPDLRKNELIELLDTYMVSVILTQDEHRIQLKKLQLSSEMPSDWDGLDSLARYEKANIQIQST